MLGLKDAALAAGVAESTIYRATKKGQISASAGSAGQLLFDASEIDRWCAARAGRASANERRTVEANADSQTLASDLARITGELAAERRRSVDLERDRDRWHELAIGTLRQLADQRQAPPARLSFWDRIFG